MAATDTGNELAEWQENLDRLIEENRSRFRGEKTSNGRFQVWLAPEGAAQSSTNEELATPPADTTARLFPSLYCIYLLAITYKQVDKHLIRNTIFKEGKIYKVTLTQDPHGYLLDGDVSELWFDCADNLIYQHEMPAHRAGYKRRMERVLRAAGPNGWRRCLIDSIERSAKNTVTELDTHRLVMCLKERELALEDLQKYFDEYYNAESSSESDVIRVTPRLNGAGLRRREPFPTDATHSPEASTPDRVTGTGNVSAGATTPSATIGGTFRGPWAVLVETYSSFLDEPLPKHFLKSAASSKTMLVLCPLSSAISAMCVGLSLTASRTPGSLPSAKDDNFFMLLSQLLFSLFSVYCIVVPLVRDDVKPAFRSWFSISIGLSIVTSIASVAVYPFQSRVSIALGFVAALTQAIATAQIVEGFHQTRRRDPSTLPRHRSRRHHSSPHRRHDQSPREIEMGRVD